METSSENERFSLRISAPPSPSVSSAKSTPQRYLTPLEVNETDSSNPGITSSPLTPGQSDSVLPDNISSCSSAVQVQPQKYFRSRRIKKGEVEQPWKNSKKDPREKWVTIIPLIGLALGFAVAGFLVFDGLRTIVHHKYELILDEDWSQGFRADIWQKEVTVGGFG